MANRNKWYVVWVGTEPGICESWAECEARVKNFPGAIYKSYHSREEAIMAYRGKPDFGLLKAIAKGPSVTVNYAAIPEIIPGSIAVDAACSGNPGIMEYRGVDIFSGKEIFHQGPFGDGTNNIGEFLALVHGLALLKQKGSDLPVYSDSRNAISWVKKKKCKTLLARTTANAPIFDLIERAEHWLENNSYTNKIIKWETSVWGEIPADFGRK